MTNETEYYEQFNIKQYTHWTLRVEDSQRYLGQAVAWLERPGDMQRLSSLTEAERNELWSAVFPEYETAIAKLWQPDHINYAWLGNAFSLHNGHGHMHIIPRYKNPRKFENLVFEDGRWGENYFPYLNEKRSPDIVLRVKDALRNEFAEPAHE
jgi:diadenosine tetraphosphate (Ap4A) HIT family hydrolase